MSAALASYLEAFWLGMALHLWQSTLILLLLAGLGLGLRLAPARYLNALLGLGLLKLAIPLSLLGALFDPLPRLFPSGFSAPSGVAEVVRVTLDPPGLAAVAAGSPGPASVGYLLLTIAWVAGIVALLARGYRRSRELEGTRLAPSPRISEANLRKLVAAHAETDVPESAVERVAGPGVAAVRGLLRPRILLSCDVIEGLTLEELRAVLLHEESHRRRRDTLLCALAHGVLVVFFFYPPVWWWVARRRAATEAVCDEAVLEQGVGPRVYAAAVARVVLSALGGSQPAAPIPVSLGQGAGLRARLDRIENSWRYRVMSRHRWLVGAALVLVLGSFGVPFLMAGKGDAPAVPPRVSDAAPDSKGLSRLIGIDTPISVTVRHRPLASVFRALEAVSATRFRIVGDLQGDAGVEAHLVSTREILERLARDHRLEYSVVDAWTVEVRRAPREVLLAGVGDVTNPKLIAADREQPAYPERARAERVMGRAVLQAVIRADGSVGALQRVHESPPDYGFAAAAEEAIRHWRYEPATRDGVPVAVYFTIFTEFKLE